MIALRRTIERGVRHPVLGPLFVLLLALLLVFTVIHGVHDQIHEGELIVCFAFLVGAILSLALPRLRDVVAAAPRSARAPPLAPVRPVYSAPGCAFGPASVPLRV